MPTTPESGQPDLMTPHEVARVLRVSFRTVHRLAAGGELPFVQVTPQKRMFHRSEVHAYLAARHRPATLAG